MKLADAENLLALRKRQGPIKERWVTETEEGVVLECWPLGFARGSLGVTDMFTVLPHIGYSGLCAGHRPHLAVAGFGGPHRLWQQEAYVYYLELRKAMMDAVRKAALAEPRDTSYAQEKMELPKAFESVTACILFLAQITKGKSEWQKEDSSNTQSSITRNKRKTKPKETSGPSQLSSLIQKWSSLPAKPKLPCSQPAQLSWEIT